MAGENPRASSAFDLRLGGKDRLGISGARGRCRIWEVGW